METVLDIEVFDIVFFTVVIVSHAKHHLLVFVTPWPQISVL